MTNPFLIALFIAFAVGTVAMAAVLAWLVMAYLALKHDYQRLSERVSSTHNDLAGLCSAALAVDRRMDTADGQLKRLSETLAGLPEHRPNGQPDHPYRSVIQKVRGGANVNELMQSAGLSHDEAALLIRLHGSKTSS
ncbi:MAG: DUF2802 domain-containing protein [Methylovulum sp.]|nr:DUF2802 domain-containing protein [Methylovulum sp.]